MIAENSNYVLRRICWGPQSLFCDKRSWQKAEPKEEMLQLVEGCTDIPLPSASLLTSWPSCTWQGSADLLLEMPLTSVPHIAYSRMTHSHVHSGEHRSLPSTSCIDTLIWSFNKEVNRITKAMCLSPIVDLSGLGNIILTSFSPQLPHLNFLMS